MKVLVTGATGFIGRHVVDVLRSRGVGVRAITRDTEKITKLWPDGSVEGVKIDLTETPNLASACRQVDSVFHLAGCAHAVDQTSTQAQRLHREITVDGTRALLEAAASSGVRALAFTSSVKAMDEGGVDCLNEEAPMNPRSAYGSAKLEAERLVLQAGRVHGMHVCVLRLPLVYGPGSKGNIPRMIASIDRARFPPLPKINNRRSMVHVYDVVQALLAAADNPAADGKVFIVTDGQPYSTREVYEAICIALGRSVPDWSVPMWVLRMGAMAGDLLERITKQSMPLTTNTLDKLLGSAHYCSGKIRRELGFVPQHTFFSALPEIVSEHRRGVAAKQ